MPVRPMQFHFDTCHHKKLPLSCLKNDHNEYILHIDYDKAPASILWCVLFAIT